MVRWTIAMLVATALVGWGAPAVAHPPSWAPAWGYRAQHDTVTVVVPRDVLIFRPPFVRVVRPVIVDGIVLLPHRTFRVVERHLDGFLIVVGTRNVLGIVRG
jgi:hypothetical protein